MHSLEAISSDKFERFLQRIGCEARGSVGDVNCYVRDDLKRPLTFNKTGEVPVPHILQCLKTLGYTVKQYLAILDDIFPEDNA